MSARRLYSVEPSHRHEQLSAVGVLLINLGTPGAPTPSSVRAYLKQFLWDPRVIELPRPLWWLLLHGIVLRRRPRVSARLYANIWTAEGSPLLVIARRLSRAVGERLRDEIGTPVHVALGMNYGKPSIPKALAELKQKGCRRILVFPLFSHYSAASTGASFDAVARELMRWRWVPEIRTILQHHDEPAYIRALAERVREHWAQHGEAEKLVTSYHGIPRRYFLDGDPYHCHCHKTSRLLAEELGLPERRWQVTFQSRFGREEWLQPYTDVTLAAMARAGVKSVDVICPAFGIDCLETLDEIDRENRHVFLLAGGESFRYVPCLNDHPSHVELLVDLVQRNLAGWIVSPGRWQEQLAATQAAAASTRQLAEEMQRRPVEPDGGYSP